MRKMIQLAVVCLLSGLGALKAQNPDSSKYIDITYIKSKAPNYISEEINFWKPVHQQFINEGTKSGWYLYRVKYPTGASAAYDYVTIGVYPDWNYLDTPYARATAIVKKLHPGLPSDSLIKRIDRVRDIVWKQIFQLIGQAVAREKSPSRFIVVNEVRTVPGAESEYVKLEQTWFKPFHASRAASGIMNNWGLYKRALPYGEKFPYDYVTMNGYLKWEDIIKNNPPDAWKKVHGDVNFNEVHDKILSKRITVNNEVWELIDYAK